MSRFLRAAAVSALALALTPPVALAAHGTTAAQTAPAKAQHDHERHQAVGRTDVRRHPMQLTLGSGYELAAGSPRVRVLQRRLAILGFAPGPVDGRYGPQTVLAVERFQAAAGLTVTGVTGPRTLARLTPEGRRVLAPGTGYRQTSGSPTVRSLQRRLIRLGISPGPVDGLYGPLTTRAVERFQHAHRLSVSGVVNGRTLQALIAPHRRTVRVRRPAAPPQSPQAAGSGGSRPGPHVNQPGNSLPMITVLLALAALGLATLGLSYARTRSRIRRPSANRPPAPAQTRAATASGRRGGPEARSAGRTQANGGQTATPIRERQIRQAGQRPAPAAVPAIQRAPSGSSGQPVQQVRPRRSVPDHPATAKEMATAENPTRNEMVTASKAPGTAAILTLDQAQVAWALLTAEQDDEATSTPADSPASAGRLLPAAASPRSVPVLRRNPVLVGLTTVGLATVAATYSRMRRGGRRSGAGRWSLAGHTRRRSGTGRPAGLTRSRGAAR